MWQNGNWTPGLRRFPYLWKNIEAWETFIVSNDGDSGSSNVTLAAVVFHFRAVCSLVKGLPFGLQFNYHYV